MKIVTTFLFIALSFIGCIDDAPRDNPLDPQSPSYTKDGGLNGRIIIANQATGISGAVVRDLTEAISVTTDSSGNFSFGKLTSGLHRFVALKENFTNDTFQVSIQPGAFSQIVRGLNGAPIVTFQRILTRKIDQFFPSTIYFVDVEADVTDPNSIYDPDSVWFNVDSSKFLLSYSGSPNKFIATLDKGVFPTNTIQYLVGKQLHIISKDRNNAVNKSDPFYVTRVIENAAVPTSPINNDVVKTDSISFHWSQPDVTFNYTYTIIVSQVISGTPKLVRTYSGVNSIDQQYPIDGSVLTLPQGNYVWAVAIVDDFGNYSRSKEYPFVAN